MVLKLRLLPGSLSSSKVGVRPLECRCHDGLLKRGLVDTLDLISFACSVRLSLLPRESAESLDTSVGI
jgi:hypothetical protein